MTPPTNGAPAPRHQGERRRKAARVAFILSTAILLAGPAFAQHHPFAVGADEGSAGAASGILAWIIAAQAHFYRLLTDAVHQTRTTSAGFWLLAGLSFAYGVFHAAGPGHGKAVMASYMVANERALKRGLVLTFLAAALQGAVAVGVVAIAALIFNATAPRMTQAAQAIELASYSAVAGLGLWLAWSKGCALLLDVRAALTPAGGALASGFTCEAIGPGHVHTSACGHLHAPHPATLDQGFSWGAALAAVVAAGARPCSGAILVLVFSLAQGVFLAGVGAVAAMSLGTALTTGALASTAVFAKGLAMRIAAGDGRGALVARSAEFIAALVVLVAGLGLLAGAWFSRATSLG